MPETAEIFCCKEMSLCCFATDKTIRKKPLMLSAAKIGVTSLLISSELCCCSTEHISQNALHSLTHTPAWMLFATGAGARKCRCGNRNRRVRHPRLHSGVRALLDHPHATGPQIDVVKVNSLIYMSCPDTVVTSTVEESQGSYRLQE